MRFFGRRALGLAVAMVCAFLAGGGSIALAAQITVTSTADSGPGSLRDAIASASGGDTINFSLAYPTTITLTSGPLAINRDLTVSGPGTSNLAINGNNASKIFEIASGATAVIANLSMENGYFGGLCCDDVYTSGGGAVENLGTLTVTAVSITNSLGARGGGINSWGTLTVNDSVIANNTTCCGLAAGGIWNAGTMAVHNSTFIGNSGYYDGGGIFNAGTATVDGSTFLNNQAAHGAGGGIYGGGVTMTITNSTFVGNTAASSGGGIGNGGGTYGGGGTAFVINSTFAGNAAPSGGALANYVTLSVKSSLLSGSTAGGNCFFGSGISTSVGYNLSDDASCAAVLTAMGDLNSTSAGLDPAGLQNNSGPTETIALLPTSLAVDHIPVSACTDTSGNHVATDQRGIARPQGAACDVGAYEYNTNPPRGAACVSPPSGMVSWWPADGSAKDIIGSNNGTLENGATFGPGAVGQAFSFDGVNQYVDVGNASSLAVSSGDFTVDAWVKFNTLGGVAATCSGGSVPNCDMSIADKMSEPNAVNSDGWRLIKQADNHFWFCLGGGTFNGCGTGGPLTVRSATVATTGQWYLVAAVKAGHTLSIYVNGSLESSITLGTGFVDTNSTDLLIGADAMVEAAYLDGEVDEVELFNRALSPLEIQALYDAGNAGKCKPTSTSISPSVNPSLLGQPVTFTATVSVGGNPITTASGETVTFSDGSATLGTGMLNSSGQATFTTSTLSLGAHSITASYPGDLSFLASMSPPLTQNVTYGICALYNQSKTVNSGAAFPIKLTLCDADGNDVSSPTIVLHATAVMMGSSFVEAPQASGNANPGDNFRFDSTLGTAGGYIFNLNTSGLASGTYSLQFTAPGDPETHSVNFGVD